MRFPDLDWELGVFKALRALWRSVAPEPPPAFDAARAAHLAALEGRLAVVGALLAGQPVRVLEARGAGGVRGRDLLLPPQIDLAPDPEANAGLYLLRAALSATVCQLAPEVPTDPEENFLASLKVFRRAGDWLSAELPGFGAAYGEALALARQARPAPGTLRGRAAAEESLIQAALAGERPWEASDAAERLRQLRVHGPPCPPVLLWGRLLPVEFDAASAEASSEAAVPAPDGTERQAPPVEELKVLQLKEEDVKELPTHVFEKVEMAEGFNGTMRPPDGSDELDEHLESLQEVDLSALIRGGEQAKSLYKADILLEADIPDVGRVEPHERPILYDEWDFRRKAYRTGWCQVYPTPLPAGSQRKAEEILARQRRLVERLHRQLFLQRAALRPCSRQRDGEDVDIDALVDARATIAAGKEPSDRLYIRQRRQQRDAAVTLLVDLSLSVDSWIDNRRVLDVVQEAALVLGEVADKLGDRLQVLAFASQTRNRVRVWEVRGWNEPWSAGRGRLPLLSPQGYTRIGPALRHATAGLAKVQAREKLLLLLSDGKPTDYDRYEGRYGIADVRQAVREAAVVGVPVHALAVDPGAKGWLPAMMGPGGWSLLRRPEDLTAALVGVYGRLG